MCTNGHLNLFGQNLKGSHETRRDQSGKTPIITYHRRNKRTNGGVNSQQYFSNVNVVTEDIEVANTNMVDPTGGIKNLPLDSCVNPILVLTRINSSTSISTTGTGGAGQPRRQLEIQSRGREVLSKETSNLPAP